MNRRMKSALLVGALLATNPMQVYAQDDYDKGETHTYDGQQGDYDKGRDHLYRRWGDHHQGGTHTYDGRQGDYDKGRTHLYRRWGDHYKGEKHTHNSQCGHKVYSVPEPSTLALMSLAILCLAFMRKKK